MSKLVKLKSLTTKIGSGATPKGGKDAYYSEGISLIRSQNVLDFRFTKDGLAYINDEQADKLDNVTVEEDDVLLNITGDSIARVCLVPKEILPARVNQHVAIIRCNQTINNKYVFYYLQYLKSYLLKICGVGGTRNALTKEAIEKLNIARQENEAERASILYSLDTKIALNNHINAELEAMAKTLYDYWFVQFDFPDAAGKPYKANGGKMVWNEKLKREIPAGWKTEKMSEWIKTDKSGDWGKEGVEGNYTEQVVCIRGTDIDGLNGLEQCTPPVRFILEKNTHKILNAHDLIVEISGGSPTQSTGRLGFITNATLERFNNPLICSNFCKALSLKDEKKLYNFVYYWKSLYDAGVLFGYEGKTSGIKNLLFESFVSSYSTVVPEERLVEKFYEFMETIQSKKQKALAENQKLAELRDWLLPMLMNGQVKIKDAATASL